MLSGEDIDYVESFNCELAHFAIECNSHARKAYKTQTCEDGICLPDPVAMSPEEVRVLRDDIRRRVGELAG